MLLYLQSISQTSASNNKTKGNLDDPMTVRQSFTAVLERNSTFQADFTTEPYEAGWASEARWFVRVLHSSGSDIELTLTPQISPDGMIWCDEGSAPMRIRPTQDKPPFLYSLGQTHFGQWLRLRGELSGAEASITVIIYLALKE